MKNILKIMIAMLFTITSFGQTNIFPTEQRIHIDDIPDGQQEDFYLKDINGVLDKFVGVWKYEAGTDIFEITFYKRIKKFTGFYYEDSLVSNFKYIKDGIIIFDTYGSTTSVTCIHGNNFEDSSNLNKINLYLKEPNLPIRVKNRRINLTYSKPLLDVTTLTWEALPVITNPGTYKIPENMVLVKQAISLD